MFLMSYPQNSISQKNNSSQNITMSKTIKLITTKTKDK